MRPAQPDHPTKTSADMAIGKHLVAWREEAGLSQVALAKILDVSQPTVARSEIGGRQMTAIDIYNWKEACDVSLKKVGEALAEGAAIDKAERAKKKT